jgi:hypothetical protein
MKFVCESFEETAYRADVLGEAVVFVEWNRNSVTVKVPREDAFERQERAIRNILACAGGDVFQ